MHTILVIEDETAIADTIVYALETEGFACQHIGVAADALQQQRMQPADLLILDVGLPDMSGFELCKRVREFSTVPIIFLTARGDEIDRVVGLEIGGDDYVAKPFSPRELVARVKVILKRANGNGVLPVASQAVPDLAAQTGFSVDAERLQIAFRGEVLSLTRYEYRILALMVEKPGRVYSREQLMMQAWEHPEHSMDRAVDTHIKSIRAKLRQLAPDEELIKTHRGLGYSLVEV